MARTLKYQLVDVFTDTRFGGNQLAVFMDATLVKEEEMLPIARELNLSETTFVLPPDDPMNHYKVRIFTPGGELPMAGHPTIGTAYSLAKALLDLGHGQEIPNIMRLEEKIGLIEVEIKLKNDQPDLITMTQPNPTFSGPITDRTIFAKLLSLSESDLHPSLPIQTVSCGVPYVFVPVNNLAAIKRVLFNHETWSKIKAKYNPGFVYVFTMETENDDSDVHGRMFAPDAGILEDAATGSANGPLGAYIVKHELMQKRDLLSITSEQGFEMGRPSFIYITIASTDQQISKVQVGGRSVSIGSGEIYLD
jgi:trans-2,3-dihydro-3-hydroxyanthranilate isomerase